jgi:hypothetical protein
MPKMDLVDAKRAGKFSEKNHIGFTVFEDHFSGPQQQA